MLSGRGLCDELITRPKESYRPWCVVVCDLETSRMRRSWPALGRSATGGKKSSCNDGHFRSLNSTRKNYRIYHFTAENKMGENAERKERPYVTAVSTAGWRKETLNLGLFKSDTTVLSTVLLQQGVYGPVSPRRGSTSVQDMHAIFSHQSFYSTSSIKLCHSPPVSWRQNHWRLFTLAK
jgi:hypothetical protein